jgi:hypothetical protein
MPWTRGLDDERRLRKSLGSALAAPGRHLQPTAGGRPSRQRTGTHRRSEGIHARRSAHVSRNGRSSCRGRAIRIMSGRFSRHGADRITSVDPGQLQISWVPRVSVAVLPLASWPPPKVPRRP